MKNGSKEPLNKVNEQEKENKKPPKRECVASARAHSGPPRVHVRWRRPNRLLGLPHPLPPRPSVVAGGTRGAGRAAKLTEKLLALRLWLGPRELAAPRDEA